MEGKFKFIYIEFFPQLQPTTTAYKGGDRGSGG
jgi:hypothetical protein